MQRRLERPIRLAWPLIVALAIVLMPARDARAQWGYGGWGYGYPGWGGMGYGGWGYGYPGWGGWGWGYGYPSIAYSYGYPFYGLGNIPISGNFVLGGPGFGYGGYGFGGDGYGLGGFGYAPGGIGVSGVGFVNPMFGAGLTPLGNSSFMMETRLLGRVPRATYPPYYGNPYRGW